MERVKKECDLNPPRNKKISLYQKISMVTYVCV